MDCENRIIDFIKDIYPFITEEYLLTLTNKGIYNRAHKDLEKLRETITAQIELEEALKVNLGEETIVHINKNISQSQCSCPSQTICRHIMTAILYCKAYYEAGIGSIEAVRTASKTPEEIQEVKNLPELNGLTIKELYKLFGKKICYEAINQLPYMQPFNIQYGKMVCITYKEQFTVYFTRENTLEQAVCSCKEKGLCIHKLYALLGYLKQEKGCVIEEEKECLKWQPPIEACVLEIKEALIEILNKGLANLTEPIIHKLEILYIKAYNHKLYAAADELKYLSSELALYFSSNIGFSNQSFMHILCRLYNRLEAMLVSKDQPDKLMLLVGKLKADEIKEKSLSLIGLGSRCFITKRKDLMMAAYFYCKEHKRVLAVSTLRPLNQKQPNALVREMQYLNVAPLIWENELSFDTIKMQQLTLEEAVIRGGKLSGSKKSRAILKGEVTSADIKPLLLTNFGEIKKQFIKEKSQYFMAYSDKQQIFLVQAEAQTQMSYNVVLQRLEWEIYDKHGEQVLCYIPFNPITKEKIKALEEDKDKVYMGFMGCFYLKSGHLEAEIYQLYKAEEEKI